MIPLSLLVVVLVQSSLANLDDPFSDPFAAYADDLADPGDDPEIEKKNSDFVRFGRSGMDGYVYEEGAGKPRKKNAIRKNDNFIRFGRNGNQFLRFGRDQNKALRNGEIYLRFGRSVAAESDDEKPRSKRSTAAAAAPDEYPKRKDAFLRFGRAPVSREIRIPADSPLVYVLAELLARRGGSQWPNTQ